MVIISEENLMKEVVETLRNEYGKDIFITDSENNDNIPKFPCVAFYKNDDYINESFRTMNTLEIGITEFYQATIYAKDSDTCKDIAWLLDKIMLSNGYQRTFNQPMFNVDTSLNRRIVRWLGTHIKESER